MGRCIRAQRRGALGSCFNAATTHKKGSSQLRKLDYSERNGYVTGLITQITHDPGRGAPVMKVKFRNPYKNQKDESVLVAPEGVYSGQFIYAGAKAKPAVGNVLPLGKMAEGECGVVMVYAWMDGVSATPAGRALEWPPLSFRDTLPHTPLKKSHLFFPPLPYHLPPPPPHPRCDCVQHGALPW